MTQSEIPILKMPNVDKAILFDKDGTLLDFERSWAPAVSHAIDRLTLDESGRAALRDVARLDVKAMTFHPDSPLIAGSSADFGPDFATILGRVADDDFLDHLDTLFQDGIHASLTPTPDAHAVLSRLKAKGYVIGLATNDAAANAHAQLERLRWKSFFDFIAGYDSGFGIKPDPGMVHGFCAAHGLEPNRVIVIGDSLHDVAMAKAAGAFAVAVTTNLASKDKFEFRADLVVSSLTEALDRLGL